VTEDERRRLRVLWLVKGLGPGGAERLLCAAAQERDRERLEYEVAYLLPWKDHLVPTLAASGVPAHCLDGARRYSPAWTVRLRRLLVERPFDVLHAHSPLVAAQARLVVRSLPRAVRPRLIYTEHNSWASYTRVTRLLNAATYPLDEAQFAVSREVWSSVPARLRRRLEVVEHGIDVAATGAHSADRDEVRRELGIDAGTTVVGTIANYRRNKAYPDLLAAARQVLDVDPTVVFVTVGQGPLQREIVAEHGRLVLGDRVRLLGYREDAVRVLAGCDIFALSSHFEGLPVALMEALALGLPVVSTAVGGIPDAVTAGREGLLVPPRRPDELAAALLALVTDPDRRKRMGAAALRRAADFDVRRASRHIEAVYLGPPGAPAGSAPSGGGAPPATGLGIPTTGGRDADQQGDDQREHREMDGVVHARLDREGREAGEHAHDHGIAPG
jgi:glycosyltransferase involved in cell wall biosynthesis